MTEMEAPFPVHRSVVSILQPGQTGQTVQPRVSRNRNKHPCDFCRYKRAACLVSVNVNGPRPSGAGDERSGIPSRLPQPPCELCRRSGRQCTFLEPPNKRRRTQSLNQEPELEPEPDTETSPHSVESLASGSPMNRLEGCDPHEASSPDEEPPSPSMMRSPTKPMSSPARQKGSMGFRTEPTGSSLDSNREQNAQLIGLTGESDPNLLRLFRFDEHDECVFQQLRIRTMHTQSTATSRPNSNDNGDGDGEVDRDRDRDRSPLPIQFMLQDNSLASKSQPRGFGPGTSEAEIRAEIDAEVSEEVGRRLILLFFRYVQPYFPILSEDHLLRQLYGDPGSLPTCLLAAIYGHALPFCVFDDRLCVEVYKPPSTDRLFQLAWMAALPTFHTPSLGAVQTMLLMIQRRPTNRHVADTPFKWVMLADTVALAQCLGLNRDPASWQIPTWEKRLRRRLAWAVYVQDSWLSLTSGRSSHIQESDWDVDEITLDDFDEAPLLAASSPRSHPATPTASPSTHFLHLASLTQIVSRIKQRLFSVKEARRLSSSLDATFDVARPLRIELAAWFQDRPDVGEQPSPVAPAHGLDGNGSIRLAYIVAKITVFRALFRPDPHGSDIPAEARAALRTGATAVAREVHEFLAKLEARHLEAFWHSYSRVNFAIASNFLLLLFATSPTAADADEALYLLTQWRSLLRIKSRSCDLLNLSLLRLDAMYVAGLGKLIHLSPAAARTASDRGL